MQLKLTLNELHFLLLNHSKIFFRMYQIFFPHPFKHWSSELRLKPI